MQKGGFRDFFLHLRGSEKRGASAAKGRESSVLKVRRREALSVHGSFTVVTAPCFLLWSNVNKRHLLMMYKKAIENEYISDIINSLSVRRGADGEFCYGQI